jgi:hypothetical protein
VDGESSDGIVLLPVSVGGVRGLTCYKSFASTLRLARM